MVGSPGLGRMALAHMARTLPGVSFPSSVVRSIIRMARSRAHSFEAFLIERLLQPVDAQLDADLVDGADPAHQPAERAAEPAGRADPRRG